MNENGHKSIEFKKNCAKNHRTNTRKAGEIIIEPENNEIENQEAVELNKSKSSSYHE